MRTPKAWGQPGPTPDGSHSQLMKRGNIRALSTYLTQRGKRRIFQCRLCETTFSETRATVFFDLRTPAEKVMMTLTMLLVNVALTDSGFVVGVTEETGLAWLRRAAQQASASKAHLRRELPVPPVQLAERWSCSRRTQGQQAGPDGESTDRGEDGRPWVWSSFAPELRWMSAAVVGPRTRDTATAVVAAPKARVAGIPACCSDGCTGALAALIAAFHVVTTCARTGKRGRPRTPRCAPHPALVYGPWVTQQKQGTLLTLSTRVVRGAERLTPLGFLSSTALVARVHLPVPQAWAPWARKTSSVCKDRERLRQRVVVFQAFSHVARPPMRVRRHLPLHARIRHGAICPRWQARTPAMAAGVTEHVWTFRELLTAKFEPLDSQSISG